MKLTFLYVLNENCIVNFCLVDLNCFIFLSSDQANGNVISKLNKMFALKLPLLFLGCVFFFFVLFFCLFVLFCFFFRFIEMVVELCQVSGL